MNIDEVARRFDAKPSGAGFMARCPAHQDDKASLSINKKDSKILVFCHAGCTIDAVLSAKSLTTRDLNNGHHPSPIVATYNYDDLTGTRRYRKHRTANKGFWFERRDGDRWVKGLGDVERLLYRRQQLVGVRELFIAEGEKDVDRLCSLGLPATTNDGGAGKWSDALTTQLEGVTNVWVLEDNDAPGRAHAETVARSCTAAGIQARIVRLPNLPDHGDVSDWLDDGHTLADLMAVCGAAAIYEPPPNERRSVRADASARRLTLQPASDLSMRRAVYLWERRLPVGMLSLLAGREGIGKSLISQTTAADLTRGRLAGCCEGQPKGVIVVATEDAWEYVILPRLAVAGADLSRCFRVNITTAKYGPVELSLPDDLPALKPLVEQHDVALLLLDPIISRLGSKLDTHVDAEVRQALEPLRAFAEALRLSILGIIHPNKSQPGVPTDPLNMIMGSRAFSAVSRSTLFLQADPEGAQLYLLHIKNNVGPLAPTLECSISDVMAGLDDAGEEVHAPRINWRGERDAHERWQSLLNALRKKEQKAGAPDSARDLAAEFLSRYLADGPMDSSLVIAAAVKAGIVKRTLQRATEDLRLKKSWTQDRPPKMLWALAHEGPAV